MALKGHALAEGVSGRARNPLAVRPGATIRRYPLQNIRGVASRDLCGDSLCIRDLLLVIGASQQRLSAATPTHCHTRLAQSNCTDSFLPAPLRCRRNRVINPRPEAEGAGVRLAEA